MNQKHEQKCEIMHKKFVIKLVVPKQSRFLKNHPQELLFRLFKVEFDRYLLRTS